MKGIKFRILATGVTVMFATSTMATGLTAIGQSVKTEVDQALRKPHGHFTQVPTPPYRVPADQAIPIPASLPSQEQSSIPTLAVSSLEMPFLTLAHGQTFSAYAGQGQPAQATLPSSGGGSVMGKVNTFNGTKLTTVPLIHWTTRGGMPVDATLYHSSNTSDDDELGQHWSWTYNIYVKPSISSAAVHWGQRPD